MAPVDALRALEHAVRNIQATRACAVSAGAIILWDHVLTFDREVELLWTLRRRLSVGKVLFFLNRYYTLSAAIFNIYVLFTNNLTDNFCHRVYQWQVACGMISVSITQITLQLRIYALYDLNKHLLVTLGVAFAASFSAALAIHVHALRQIRATSHAVPGLPFCVPHGVPARYWTVWVPILAFEVLLLALAVHRAAADDGGPRRIVHARRLVDILVRDSVAYFFVVFGAYLTNLVVWAFGPPDVLDLPIVFSEAFSCVMCSHVLLNMHASVAAPAGTDSDTPVQLLALQTRPDSEFDAGPDRERDGPAKVGLR